jgi:hypothetical protein
MSLFDRKIVDFIWRGVLELSRSPKPLLDPGGRFASETVYNGFMYDNGHSPTEKSFRSGVTTM